MIEATPSAILPALPHSRWPRRHWVDLHELKSRHNNRIYRAAPNRELPSAGVCRAVWKAFPPLVKTHNGLKLHPKKRVGPPAPLTGRAKEKNRKHYAYYLIISPGPCPTATPRRARPGSIPPELAGDCLLDQFAGKDRGQKFHRQGFHPEGRGGQRPQSRHAGLRLSRRKSGIRWWPGKATGPSSRM